jgi:hypothetical protein
VVKGQANQRLSDVVRLEVKQLRNPFGFRPVPGVWSTVPIDPGKRLVVFGRSSSEDAAAAMSDSNCMLVVSAEEALTDIHLAAQADSNRLDLSALLALAKPAAASLDWLFADYLWARYETDAMSDITKFDQIATFVEDPRLGQVAKTTMVMALTTDVGMLEPPSHVDRLVILLFRLLDAPEFMSQHGNLVGTYLPNLLGITSGVHQRSASEVFHDQPVERRRAEHAIHSYKGDQPVEPLIEWLRR